MKAKIKLFILLGFLTLLTSCYHYNSCSCPGCGCSGTVWSEANCADTNSCWDGGCSGSRCAHVFDNVGWDGYPSSCYTDEYTY